MTLQQFSWFSKIIIIIIIIIIVVQHINKQNSIEQNILWCSV